jgi:glycosyltransferase involved in cell wall biosynthesis
VKPKVTIKSLLLNYMSGAPGVGLPMPKLQQCSAVLHEFVAGARFDDSIVCARDSAYTRISIVMPSYNQVHFIERSILSVLNQNYPHLQFIIMDGGSTDGTLDVIRKYEKHLCWRSEPDRGQSDALNKALMLADGELVGWLNSDDVYFPGVLYRMHELSHQTPEAVLYTGSVARIDADDRLIRVPRHVPPSVRSLLFGFPMQSQGVFWRREVQSHAGLYDTGLHYAMDFDFWLKVLTLGRAEYIPELVGGFRTYEGTKTSEAPERGQAEVRAVRMKYGTDDATARWRIRRNIMVLSDLFLRIFVIRRHCVTISKP